MLPQPQRERRAWTEDEDHLLREAVRRVDGDSPHQPSNWNAIAKYVPGRNNKDCRKRWFARMASAVNRGAWSPAEDEKLVQAVNQYGQQWSLVATVVVTRNSDQCAKRWTDAVNPSIDHSAWRPDEDVILFDAVEKHGRSWAYIVRTSLPRRTGLAAKNRYNQLTRASNLQRIRSSPNHLTDDSLLRERSSLSPYSRRGEVGGPIPMPENWSPDSNVSSAPSVKAEYLDYRPQPTLPTIKTEYAAQSLSQPFIQEPVPTFAAYQESRMVEQPRISHMQPFEQPHGSYSSPSSSTWPSPSVTDLHTHPSHNWGSDNCAVQHQPPSGQPTYQGWAPSLPQHQGWMETPRQEMADDHHHMTGQHPTAAQRRPSQMEIQWYPTPQATAMNYGYRS